MTQSKTMSLVEAVMNTLVGLLLAFLVNALLMQLTGVQATYLQNFLIVAGHTVVSTARSYLLRRVFNCFIFFKGATAYEFQVGKLGGRIVHLQGERWRWKPWRRVQLDWEG